jgi:thioredoxin reductase (NADPH)
MSNPVLVAVHTDVEALREIERELIDRYGRHYRVLCTSSPAEAQAQLEEIAAQGDPVALVLAERSLAGTTGSELLDQARHLHPQSKRGLLIEWGDWGDRAVGEEIFQSIGRGCIDHHVVRPFGPADELFHQAVSSLLLDWAEAQRRTANTVHIVSESWSGRAFELRELLERCAIPHSFRLADSNEGREFVAAAGEGAELPIVAMPDGRVLVNPSNVEMAEELG